MNIREISVARLREYENNPRNNDLAVEKVKYSIQRFGFLFPVIVDMNYTIVAGHTRVRACRELGLPSVPCIIADELTEEQVNFFRLVDNKTSEYSDWDFEKLKSELSLIDLTLDENQLLIRWSASSKSWASSRPAPLLRSRPSSPSPLTPARFFSRASPPTRPCGCVSAAMTRPWSK